LAFGERREVRCPDLLDAMKANGTRVVLAAAHLNPDEGAGLYADLRLQQERS
jgi:hypothetical protein